MRQILLIASLLLTQFILGQNIMPIPSDTTAQWRILRGYNDGTCANMYNSIYYVGDTVVHNNKIFYEILETGEFYQEMINPPGPCNQSYFYFEEYRGAIRSENGKTYKWSWDHESLLMDFTLNVGDTLNSSISPGLIISSIDSVLVGQEYRTRFNFSNGDICNWMIEGIGHEAGLFEPMITILEFYSIFNCYGENNINLFGDTNCILNVGIKEQVIFPKESIVLYPNPVDKTLNINLKENKLVKSIIIVNGMGEIVFKSNKIVMSSDLKIDLSYYCSGLYFINIIFNSNKTFSGKFIKK